MAGQRQKRNYDKNGYGTSYNVGDVVLLYNPKKKKGLSPKLFRRWEGPFLVIGKLSDVTYRIQKSVNAKGVVVHHNRLKRFENDEIPVWMQKINATPSTDDPAHKIIPGVTA